MAVLHQTADHRFDISEGATKFWPEKPILGRLEQDFMESSTGRQFFDAAEKCRTTGMSQVFEFELPDSGVHLEATMLADGEGVLTILTDVTERRAGDAATKVLLREVSHRSKNLLAIVQSIAMQTAVHTGDVQDFLDKFRGRLHALSGTQDLVTESDWRGTRLQSLVTSQLTRAGQFNLSRVRITGEDPILTPNASLHIGLAIHELSVNAVLHGSLAEGKQGQVWLDAKLAPANGRDPALIIEWRETGIDTAATLNTPHFGTLILDRIVPLSVGGTAQYELSPGDLSYTLTIPADQFEL